MPLLNRPPQIMSEHTCKHIWFVDDFSFCARHRYLEVGIPFILLLSSLFFIFYYCLDKIYSRPPSIKLKLEEEEAPLLASGSSNRYNSATNDVDENLINATVAERHFEIQFIKPVDEDGKPIGVIKTVFRGPKDNFFLVLQYMLVLTQVSFSIALFFVEDFNKEWKSHYPAIGHLTFWSYLLILNSVRLYHIKEGLSEYFPNLWYHTFILNILFWGNSFFLGRSAILNHTKSTYIKWYYLAEFITSTSVTILQGFDNFSDRHVNLYIEDGLRPTSEPMNSFFNIASFSWVNDMIKHAQSASTKMSDILCLKLEDNAYPSIVKFHQSKKFNSFSIDMFWQFRKLFFYQCVLTSADAVIVFFPSMLLKTILDYVTSPDTQSASLAWLFVILMLFSAPMSSAIGGRCLFIGRRICTRMRAILIGEVYAKALRRKLTESNKDKDAKDDNAEEPLQDSISNKEVSDEQVEKARDMGAIINLVAVDSFKVSEICAYIYYFVNSFVMTVIAITVLYTLLGRAALIGTLTIIMLLPINYRISMKIGKLQKKMLKVTDKRISKLNETFQNIRIIKYFAWETKFADQIMQIRKEELDILFARCVTWAYAAFIWLITPSLICLVSFYWFTIIDGHKLTTSIAFTALSLFNLLRTPLDQFAEMLSYVIQSKVSLDRVSDFLDEPESTKYEQLSLPKDPNSPDVGFQNASFSWSNGRKGDFKLRDIDIEFKKGKLNVIVGATGSGKTSLLLALLGEMNLQSGKVFLPGATPRDELVVNKFTGLTESVAYCSQTAWLLNGTIKDNILFASPFDEKRYKDVVEACGLKRDFEILSAGDKTEIGEKGITLSGGQKQRVSLARALYSKAAYVLLDDCLSAVDSHTSVHIYEQCITGPLMNNRTCILVSHNIALTIKEADHVVIMDNGRVKIQGETDYLFKEKAFDDETISSILQSRSTSTANLQDLLTADPRIPHPQLLSSTLASISADLHAEPITQDDIGVDGKLVEEEVKAEGAVSWSVYKTYIESFGNKYIWITLFTVFILAQTINIGQSYWLRIWGIAEDSKAGINEITEPIFALDIATDAVMSKWSSVFSTMKNFQWNEPIFARYLVNFEVSELGPVHSTLYYLSMYSLLGLVYAIVGIGRVYIAFSGGLRVSHYMFKNLLMKVMRAEVRFFDSTPIGRIMNRFSKDIEGIDQDLPPSAEMLIICSIACISTVILITFITPAFLIFGVFMSWIMFKVGAAYLSISRELKRLEAVTRSPINQHFTETLVGVTTLRAYGDERRFMVENMSKIDANNRPFFYVWVNNRWMSFRAQLVGSMLVVFSSALAVFYARSIDAGLAGISLSFAASFSTNALWLLRCYADVEINLNSVERVQEYIDTVTLEPAPLIPENDPSASWPEKGEIDVKGLALRYAPHLPQVINDISFHVNAGEKVGVVGRTGAGKSTIITSFFRFIEPDNGSIIIDGVDIGKIGLDRLRRGLTIIPQEPTLFTGTLRSNLDMFNEYSDIDIYESLNRVGLLSNEEFSGVKIKIEAGQSLSEQSIKGDEEDENVNKFLDLINEVSEGGSNLSQGERQLVCLARSLLKRPKILMLDEATASIDYDTDAKIQTTIREEFSDSTILTIAHRLKTIIDYDKILVLDQGTAKEYDHPYTLITDKSTQFHSMCMDTGEFNELVKTAKIAYLKTHGDSTGLIPEIESNESMETNEIDSEQSETVESNTNTTIPSSRTNSGRSSNKRGKKKKGKKRH